MISTMDPSPFHEKDLDPEAEDPERGSSDPQQRA